MYAYSGRMRLQLGILHGVLCLYLNYYGQWEKAQPILKMLIEKEQPMTGKHSGIFPVFYKWLSFFISEIFHCLSEWSLKLHISRSDVV